MQRSKAMPNKYLLTMSLVWCLSSELMAQSGIENVLTLIVQNNKELASNKQYAASQSIGFKRGMYLANPSFEYDYMKGTPVEAGNQTDFTITQSFDFPSSYFKKGELVDQQTIQLQLQIAAKRQDILLEAKLTCLELVYHHKKEKDLTNRVQRIGVLASDYEKRLEQGDASILDVNKAKLQLINLTYELRENTTAINLLNQKLTELNGGNEIIFKDTLYPTSPIIPVFSMVDSLIEANDPLVKTVKQQKAIYEKEVALSKALSYPKLEAGYHYQSILGQRYQGVHFGLTIPLWENKHTVQFQRAQVVLSNLQIQQHRLEHFRANKQLYSQYENLRMSLSDYEQYLSTIQTTSLLDKALKLGQISTIEYFLEISYLFTTYEKYLQLENKYHKVIAQLYKFEL